MRHLILAALLLAPLPALAAPAPQPDPASLFAGALAQNVSTLLVRNSALETQVATLQAQVAKLTPKPAAKAGAVHAH